ncbi:MAG: hypothetical protein JWR47_1369 [Phenylobacterium sp.]|nr:hypothetical protein [Phenylobacterium sp.]
MGGAGVYDFGGVALGGVLGAVDPGGLTWPVDGVSAGGVAEGGVAVVASLLGDVVVDGPVVAEASGVASGVERVSEPVAAVAAVLAVEPVEAVEAMVWPDHQSFRARCAGEAFR